MTFNDIVTIAVALIVGAGIGLQGALNARLGTHLNPFANGLMVMIAGGFVALAIFLVVRGQFTPQDTQVTAQQGIFIVLSGVLGIVAIGGSTFVLPRLGIVTGIMIVLVGQILIGIVFDGVGFSGNVVSLTPIRGIGLLLIVVGVGLVNTKG
jgi:transporter family-2 protein